jgi:hypothetical protein
MTTFYCHVATPAQKQYGARRVEHPLPDLLLDTTPCASSQHRFSACGLSNHIEPSLDFGPHARARSVHGVLPVGRWGLARDDAGLLALTHSTLNLYILTSTTYQPVSRKFAFLLFLTLRICHRDGMQRKDLATSGEDLYSIMGLGLCSDVRPPRSLQHRLGCPSIAILTSPTLGNCLSVWAICRCMSFTHSTSSICQQGSVGERNRIV